VSSTPCEFAIEQAHPEGAFDFGYRFRDCGMGNPQPGRRLRHAAGVGDRHEDMKVAQLQPAADSIRPVHFASLNLEVTGMPHFSVYQIMPGPTRVTAVHDLPEPK
jgi:hypothetical protein